MRLMTFAELMAMPTGTVFCEYDAGRFDNLSIKSSGPVGGVTFYRWDIGFRDHGGTEAFCRCVDNAEEGEDVAAGIYGSHTIDHTAPRVTSARFGVFQPNEVAQIAGALLRSITPDLQRFRMAVQRELGLRRRVYPKWVEAKRMSRASADNEIAVMADLLDLLARLDDAAGGLLDQ